MKVLHVTKKYPNALGGDAVVVSNLEKQQKAHGHKVVILTSNCDETKNGKAIYKFGLKDTSSALDNITIKRLLSLVMLFFKAFKVLRAERPDVIHTHSVDMAFSVSFAARLYEIPIVHTFHIVTYYDENQSPLRRKVELLFARGARPTIVTAPNVYDVKKLREAGLNAVELSNGIDLGFWKRDAKTMKNKTFTFVTVGRLEEQKGNEYLIKAAALLRKKTKTKFKLTIVGTGSLERPLKELAKSLGVNDCIEFVGRKSPAETRQIYNTSHVAIFPSLYETTPITLLEAWAMQTPTIATRVGILRDLKKVFTSLVVKVRDCTSLERAMEKLMRDTALREDIAHASYEQAKNLAWTKISNFAEQIYRQATLDVGTYHESRIVQVSAYYPPHLGGQESVVLDLSTQLLNYGQKVEVITSSQGSKSGVSYEKGVKVTRLPSIEFAHTAFIWKLLPTLLRLNRKDVVHLHIGQAYTPEMVYIASRLKGFRYVAHMHADFAKTGPMGHILPIYERVFIKRVVNRASAVITLNKEYELAVRNKFDYRGRVIVKSNGVNDLYFSIRNKGSVQNDKCIKLIFVGRLCKHKNLLSLLDVMSKMQQVAKLDIIGDGELRGEIESIIKDKKLDNVRLHGRLDREEVLKYYKKCDALVLPSLYETQGLVLLEAMASRVPIIASNISGIEETAKDIGILVPPTPEGIKSGIEALLSKSAKEQLELVDRGYDKADSLRWSKLAPSYVNLYRKIENEANV